MQQLELIRSKIVNLETYKEYALHGKKVVFTNGCFDILHLGHVEYLSKAKDFGDVLVVGLNTDASIKRIKGENRPINNNETRATILASLSFIDFVILFDDDTPLNLISSILPDILVKGADYVASDIVGADVVIKHGGLVKTIALTEGFSTSNIINKLIC